MVWVYEPSIYEVLCEPSIKTLGHAQLFCSRSTQPTDHPRKQRSMMPDCKFSLSLHTQSAWRWLKVWGKSQMTARWNSGKESKRTFLCGHSPSSVKQRSLNETTKPQENSKGKTMLPQQNNETLKPQRRLMTYCKFSNLPSPPYPHPLPSQAFN